VEEIDAHTVVDKLCVAWEEVDGLSVPEVVKEGWGVELALPLLPPVPLVRLEGEKRGLAVPDLDPPALPPPPPLLALIEELLDMDGVPSPQDAEGDGDTAAPVFDPRGVAVMEGDTNDVPLPPRGCKSGVSVVVGDTPTLPVPSIAPLPLGVNDTEVEAVSPFPPEGLAVTHLL
jgi:hypothetical protein